MMLVKTKIKPSPIHGLGCFTEEPIKKGTLVWKFIPHFDQYLTKEEILTLPPPAQIFLATYAYKSKRSGLYILCSDNGKYFNHSLDPNTQSTDTPTEKENDTYALRDIAVGEELTSNYSAFENDYGTEENVLEDMFKKYNLIDEVDPRLK